MSLIFSKTCELAFQATIFFSTREEYYVFTAKEIAEKLEVPKEYLAKVLQILTKLGVIGSKKGKNGGFFLNKNKLNLKLIDIVREVDGLEVFEKCLLGYPGCGVTDHCPVHDTWGKIRDEIYQLLENTTLDQLEGKTYERLKLI